MNCTLLKNPKTIMMMKNLMNILHNRIIQLCQHLIAQYYYSQQKKNSFVLMLFFLLSSLGVFYYLFIKNSSILEIISLFIGILVSFTFHSLIKYSNNDFIKTIQYAISNVIITFICLVFLFLLFCYFGI